MAMALPMSCDQSADQSFEAGRENAPGVAPGGTNGLTKPNRGVPAVAGFDMEIALSGADIALSWDDVGGPYDVWRSTDPYFEPGDAGSTMLATGVAAANYDDVGGNDSTSYYYRVTGGGAQLSTIAGKYVRGLVPGYNKVSQPLISDLTGAEEFAGSFGGANKPSSVHKFNASTQDYSTWYYGYDPAWGVFEYGLGECPIYRSPWGAGPFDHPTVGLVPAYGEMNISLAPGHNYVTVPLYLGDTMASDMLNLLPEGATLAYFEPFGLSAPYSGGAEGDFPISAGQCISVSVADGGDWPPPFDPLTQLNDEFDGDLSGWTETFNPQDANVSVDNGVCTIVPEPDVGWFGMGTAFHMAKPVSGDFCVTASVEVTNAAGEPAYPGGLFRMGGVMIRNPATALPNTYHVGLGVLTLPENIYEFKSTQDGVSTVGEYTWEETMSEVRICRLGDTVHGLGRMPGGDWQLMNESLRPDLPQEVVAGPVSYGSQADPDIVCQCDWVRFKSIASLAEGLVD